MQLTRHLAIAAVVGSACAGPAGAAPAPLVPWSAGTLDIHHIQTGRGNATFIVAPDGTTILIDAGALDPKNIEFDNAPLKLAPAVPDARLRPGQWIARYIRQVARAGHARVDYAIVTHFHTDHIGAVLADSPWSATRAYRLTGLTDVGDALPIGTLIDRSQPGDPSPRDDASIRNYRAFARYLHERRGTRLAPLAIGRTDQIALARPRAYPGFAVLGVKAGSRVMDGQGGTVAAVDPARARNADGTAQENPLSIALKLTFGAFDYYAGGDNTGLHETYAPEILDSEAAIAPVVGAVDAMALDHHGNCDSTNVGLLATLKPRVLVEQVYTTDQPGGEVVHRVASQALYPGKRDLFATWTFDATRIALGPILDRTLSASGGHVLIRVAPGGDSYRVMLLDARARTPTVLRTFGPYQSR